MEELSKRTKHNSNNKIINYNMNKNILRNFNRLKNKVNNITNSTGKGLGKEILKLYENRQISQFHGAEKIINE